MVQRLYTYEKFEEIYDIIPRSIFPKEYGGDEGSCKEISGTEEDNIFLPNKECYFSNSFQTSI